MKGETIMVNIRSVSNIWDSKVPGTTKIFGWRALLDRPPSRANHERRGVGVGFMH